MDTNSPYITIRDGRAFIIGHRVPVTALAALWREGASPETIRENYPSISLAQVLGGLAYYLDHQAKIDDQVAKDEETFLRLQAEQLALHPERKAEWDRRRKMLEARQSTAP